MALKVKLTKAEHEKLDDGLKIYYTADGEGFKLQVAGGHVTDQDPANLMSALEAERKRREEFGKELADLKASKQKEIDDAAEKAAEEARKKALEDGDLVGITERLEKQIADQQASFDKQLKERDKALEAERERARKIQIDTTAESMASKICLPGEYASLLAPQIAARLAVGEDGRLAVLGESGQPDPQMTLETLEKSYVDNEAFSAMMKGTEARGASGTPTTGGTPVDIAGKKWSEVSSEDKVALKRNDPDAYTALLKTK